MDWLTVTMEEYKALRTEISDSLKNQQAIMSMGLTSVGVLFGLVLNAWEAHIWPSILILMLGIPMFCYIIIIIWVGELKRIVRVGKFIHEKEQKINNYFIKNKKNDSIDEKDVLSWEMYIKKFKTKLHTSYYWVILLFFGIGLLSIVIGSNCLDNVNSQYGYWWIYFFVIVEFIIAFGGYIKALKSPTDDTTGPKPSQQIDQTDSQKPSIT